MKTRSTFRSINENLSNKNRAWLVVGALSKLQGYSNGTPYNPIEEASANYCGYLGNVPVSDIHLSLMEKILRDGVCGQYTGDVIIDLTETTLFVGWSSRAVKEYGIVETWIGDLANQEVEEN